MTKYNYHKKYGSFIWQSPNTLKFMTKKIVKIIIENVVSHVKCHSYNLQRILLKNLQQTELVFDSFNFIRYFFICIAAFVYCRNVLVCFRVAPDLDLLSSRISINLSIQLSSSWSQCIIQYECIICRTLFFCKQALQKF